jgi:hypothetical protein
MSSDCLQTGQQVFSRSQGVAMSEDVIATCDEIDAEIVRVLMEKFSWEQHRATSALQAILVRGIRVKIRHGKGMP